MKLNAPLVNIATNATEQSPDVVIAVIVVRGGIKTQFFFLHLSFHFRHVCVVGGSIIRDGFLQLIHSLDACM